MKWSTTAVSLLVLGGALQSTTTTGTMMMANHNLRGGMRSLQSVALGGKHPHAPAARNTGFRSLGQHVCNVYLQDQDKARLCKLIYALMQPNTGVSQAKKEGLKVQVEGAIEKLIVGECNMEVIQDVADTLGIKTSYISQMLNKDECVLYHCPDCTGPSLAETDYHKDCFEGKYKCMEASDYSTTGRTVCRPVFHDSTKLCSPLGARGTCDSGDKCDGEGYCGSVKSPSSFQDTTFTCRASNGPCDQDAYCTGESHDCPTNFRPSTYQCRASNGPCDQDAYCTGESHECPTNFRPSTYQCRASNGPCDQDAYCTGESHECPTNFRPSTYQCRASVSDCDLDAYCNGESHECPTNFRPSTYQCRASNGPCDQDAYCTGESHECPTNFRPSTYQCRASNGPCDQDAYCTGESHECPTNFRPSTYQCRASNGPCDQDAYCTGESHECPTNFRPSTYQCRASVSDCDLDAYCNGESHECPTNYRPSTYQCRASNGPCGDLVAYCTGDSKDCPDTCVELDTKLVADAGAAGDLFGSSVAISGDTLVVGSAWYDDKDKGVDSGSAYVFERSGGVWTQKAKLLALDEAEYDYFGWSVAIAGDTIVVGSPYDDVKGVSSGSAYVFERSGDVWTQKAKLLADDGASGDYFGGSVAIAADTIVVGSPAYYKGASSGSAYVFERSGGNWTQKNKLVALDGASGDRFGESVAIAGDTVVVGSPYDDDKGVSSGSAYVFERSGGNWTQKAKLLALDGAAGDLFGKSVAISGDTVVVGSILDDDEGASSGSAYVFERSGGDWTQKAKLLALDGAAHDQFGWSVAISGDTIVVGSPSGSAYVFERSGDVWTQKNKLVALDGALGDFFGYSVAISDDTVVVGSPYDDDKGDNSGSAYVIVV